MSEHIGSKVLIPGTRGYGTLQYHGGILGKLGLFGGVELTGSIATSRGKNSGDVDGVQYFTVEQPMTGLFLPWDRLINANPHLELKRSSYGSNSSPSSRSLIGLKLSGTKSPGMKRSSVMGNLLSNSPNSRNSEHFGLSDKIAKFEKIGSERPERHERFAEKAERFSSEKLERLAEKPERLNSQFGDRSNRPGSGPTAIERERITERISGNSLASPGLGLSGARLFEKTEQRTSSRASQGSRRVSVEQTLSAEASEIDFALESSYRESREPQEDLVATIASLRSEMREKTEILDNLRSTVNELQPLLEEYETEIAEKDKKLSKQRLDFEKSREEWRSSLDLMLQEQQENEHFYEQKAEELSRKLEISNLETIKLTSTHEDELSKLTLQLDEVKMEERKFQAQLEGRDIELRILREKLENTTEVPLPEPNVSADDIDENTLYDKNFLEMKIGQLQRDLNFMQEENALLREIIEELELKLIYKDAELGSIIEKNLVNKVKLVSIDDNSYEQHITELRHELDMRPTFDELVDLQNSIEQLAEIHRNDIVLTEEELRRVISENRDLQDKLEKILTEQEESRVHVERIAPSESNNDLPIFKPTYVDPSSGKNDWCGLCERDGHSSIDCPYENDIF